MDMLFGDDFLALPSTQNEQAKKKIKVQTLREDCKKST